MELIVAETHHAGNYDTIDSAITERMKGIHIMNKTVTAIATTVLLLSLMAYALGLDFWRLFK